MVNDCHNHPIRERNVMQKWIYLYLVLLNLAAFALFGTDKFKAKAGGRRIPESTLIGISVIGGALGAYLGMRIWHHKTRKWKFRLLVPLCLIGWAFLLMYLH